MRSIESVSEGGGAGAGRDSVSYWTLYLESHTCPFRIHYSNYKAFNQDGVLRAAKQLEEAGLVASFCAFTFCHSTQPPTNAHVAITVTAQDIPRLLVSQYRLRTMKLKVRLEVKLKFTLVSVVEPASHRKTWAIKSVHWTVCARDSPVTRRLLFALQTKV